MDRLSVSAAPRAPAPEKYWETVGRRSCEEKRTLASVKRLVERYHADATFRQALTENLDASQGVAAAYGIEIDPRLALPLFHPDYRQFRFSDEAAERWPAAKIWDDYLSEMAECRTLFCQTADCPEINPRFHRWRQRQMRRANNELGPVARTLTHPILAFELSAGCSVGCWFCGVSAGKFGGYFPYSDANSRLWRSILDRTVELFGAAAQTGFCYWATDPADNPDYPRFLEDFYFATGNIPQTTTAVPLRNLDFTRTVLRRSRQYRGLPNRFSILTLKIFDAVHKTFSAEELMHVELVLQNRESLTAKALAGRVRERSGAGKTAPAGSIEANQTTIACVTGFLINMVNRTIRLITPVRASARWPLGYRVYGERGFDTADDYHAAVKDLIDTHMSDEIGNTAAARFRDDITYIAGPDGFELRTANSNFVLAGFQGARLLGDLIHRGDMTVGEVHATVMRSGLDIFAVANSLRQLFHHGLLSEDPPGHDMTIAAREEQRLFGIAEAAAAST